MSTGQCVEVYDLKLSPGQVDEGLLGVKQIETGSRTSKVEVTLVETPSYLGSIEIDLIMPESRAPKPLEISIRPYVL